MFNNVGRVTSGSSYAVGNAGGNGSKKPSNNDVKKELKQGQQEFSGSKESEAELMKSSDALAALNAFMVKSSESKSEENYGNMMANALYEALPANYKSAYDNVSKDVAQRAMEAVTSDEFSAIMAEYFR